MRYRVITGFEDLQDGLHHYDAGDEYPRDGVKPSEARIRELSTDQNKRRIPLIEKVEEKPKRKKRND